MHFVAVLAVMIVALLHVGLVLLETVWWGRKPVNRVFHVTPDFARQARPLAWNQGVYTAFLVAGLAWAITHIDAVAGREIATFFLICAAVAGLFAAATARRGALLVQALPALVALGLVWLTPVTPDGRRDLHPVDVAVGVSTVALPAATLR